MEDELGGRHEMEASLLALDCEGAKLMVPDFYGVSARRESHRAGALPEATRSSVLSKLDGLGFGSFGLFGCEGDNFLGAW